MTGPLHDVHVVDLATIVAGPGAARHLADFGARVTKVEAPGGDAARRLGWRPPNGDTPHDDAGDGPDAYYWKLLGRNKTPVTLDLRTAHGRDALLDLVDEADVVIENMRPGKLEALGLGQEVLFARRPSLVLTRVTAFGQDGPLASRPGFATIAEAMSGYASISGTEDGGPQLPPVALTDELTAISGAFATMTALWHARRTGEGQVVDVSLLDSVIQILGPLPSAWAHLGYEQPRLGGGIPYSVPRGTYRCRDGTWIAVSSSSDRLAARLLATIGLGDDPRFATFTGRVEHRDELEAAMTSWCAELDADEAIRRLEDADAAVTAVLSVGELTEHPHAKARELFVEVDGVVQQRPIARLSATPPTVRWAGRPMAPRSDDGETTPPADTGPTGS